MTDDMPRTVTVTDDEILNALEGSKDPIATSAELAEIVDLSQDGVRRRLNSMEEDGKVISKKVGARSVVWWADS